MNRLMVDDVMVDVESSEDVLLGVQGVLVLASHHHLGVVDQVEEEHECSNANHPVPEKIFYEQQDVMMLQLLVLLPVDVGSSRGPHDDGKWQG